MQNSNWLKEFRSAGLVSKTLHERIVLTTAGEPPAPINPTLPQNDANISGHSTADKPLANNPPEAQAPAAEAGANKTQKDYLMSAASASIAAAEACMESLCEGKCFEAMPMDQAKMQEMQEMHGKLKEFKGKMEQWKAEPAADAAPVPPAAMPQNTAPAENAPAAPAPIPAPAPIAA